VVGLRVVVVELAGFDGFAVPPLLQQQRAVPGGARALDW